MLMLHGLGSFATTASTGTATPMASQTSRYFATGFVKNPPMPPMPPVPPPGCPAGYVQTEFGCMAPTKPSAPCPPGSTQTGNGCLPTVLPQVPSDPPGRVVTFDPPQQPPVASWAPSWFPSSQTAGEKLEAEYRACQADPTHHDCRELAALLDRLNQQTQPISTNPVVSPTAPPATFAPPAKMSVGKVAAIAGGLGVLALIGTALFNR